MKPPRPHSSDQSDASPQATRRGFLNRMRTSILGGILGAAAIVTAYGGGFATEHLMHHEEPAPIVLVTNPRHAGIEPVHLEEPVAVNVPRRQLPPDSAATRATCETAIRIQNPLTHVNTISQRSFAHTDRDMIYVYAVELSGTGPQGNSRLSYLVECRVTNDGQLLLRFLG